MISPVPLVLALLLTGLPDPASVMVAVEDTPEGLLYTDGRHTGLYLQRSYGEPVVLSNEPGAGGNVLVTDGGILFKECPHNGAQRVVRTTWGGEAAVLHSGVRFSGPFRGGEDTFLFAERGRVVEMSLQGRISHEWPITGCPASAVLSGCTPLYTLESGGLSGMDFYEDQCFTRLETGPEGLLLAEMSPRGFLVIDRTGGIVIEEPEGSFPSWSAEGSVIYSTLEYSGMEPVSGSVTEIDPFTGNRRILSRQGLPIYPLLLLDGSLTWTGEDGTLTGIDACLPSKVQHAKADTEGLEPDAHFDVAYMHQRWDTPDWFNGSWSCGPTSCVMTTQYYLRLTPDSIWASYPSPGHWSLWGNYIPVEYTFLGYTYDELGESPGGPVPGAHGFICPDGGAWWNLMVEFLNRHGIYSAWAGTSWSTLTGEIDSFYPVVCSSSVLGCGHIILLNGYYDDHTVVVNDPYGDANEPGWGSYYNGKDVLYDWPGYNNGHVQIGVSQLFYARAPVPSDPDTLVDDCSRGFLKYADCRYWHLTGSGFQGNAWWTYSTGAPPDTCFAEWHPELPFTGDYEVSVYIPPDRSTATGIYSVRTVSGTQDVILDQGLYSDEWVSLGVFPLGNDPYLRLGDYTGTGGQYIAFDAALFSPAGTGGGGGTPDAGPVLEVRPNPCGGILSIYAPGLGECLTADIYDMAGRLVLHADLDGAGGTFILDTSSLCRGVYVLRAAGGGADTLSRLITVCD
ncbi:MAG: C39 family peptidase [Candidatus Fermentibacteraceae bacterium]|nr:C39 family peptidase [Candidatus Fermentibacteraceae bacterium]